MVITEVHINNIPAALRYVTEYAYVEDGCLWIYNDADDVTVYPIHTISSLTFKRLESLEKPSGSTEDTESSDSI